MILLFLIEAPLLVGRGSSAFRLPLIVTFLGGILKKWEAVKCLRRYCRWRMETNGLVSVSFV